MDRGKVFLVDDDPSVRRALERLILAGGYEGEVLADAASYLSCAVPSPPSPACLLLDIRMPGIGGFELAEMIRGTPCALPVVFITGHGDEDSRNRAMALGAVELLFKPIDERALFAAIDRALAVPRS